MDGLKEIQESLKTFGASIEEYKELGTKQMAAIAANAEASEQIKSRMDELEKTLKNVDGVNEKLAEFKGRIDAMETAAHSSRSQSNEPKGPYKTFGEQLLDVYRADKKHDSEAIARLMSVEGAKAGTGLSESVPADGGFLVQQDFSSTMLQRSYQMGEIMQRVQKIGISPGSNGLRVPGVNETSRANGSRNGGITMAWLAEGGTKSASTPAFRMVELNLHKLAGLCYITDELLADTSALESWLRMKFPEEITYMVENAVIRGTGVGQPLGILNSGATTTQAAEGGQAADTILVQNIHKMYSRMYAASRKNAVWFINQDIEPQLFGMTLNVGTGGQAVYMPPGGVSQSPYGTLMGRPVIPIEYASTLGDEGDIMFLDLSEYLMIDKGGVQQDSSIHVAFTTDETVLRFVYRCDGQPTWNSELTPANSTVTQSPWITLATR